jgi:hypothetical protein
MVSGTAIIGGAIYYLINIGYVFWYLGRRLLHRMRGGKSFRKVAADLITSLVNAYQELRENSIHVPSLRRAVEQAREKGVSWDPQLFCILDNVAEKNPSAWIVRPA